MAGISMTMTPRDGAIRWTTRLPRVRGDIDQIKCLALDRNPTPPLGPYWVGRSAQRQTLVHTPPLADWRAIGWRLNKATLTFFEPS